MKPSILILAAVFFACALSGQANLNASHQKVVTAGYTARNGSIVETGMLVLKGREISTSDSVLRCNGDCEVTIHNIILKADELDLHSNTGDVEALGDVRVKLLPQSQRPTR
jgi:lipopolysaccharide assembly outer membrane protein LptD (OstA)